MILEAWHRKAAAGFLVLLVATSCDHAFVVGSNASPPGAPLADAAPFCRLMFDVAHGERRFSDPENFASAHGWGPTVELLESRGYEWQVNQGSITQVTPGAAWIISEPTEAFAPQEIDALEDFVRTGGALLLTTDLTVDFMNPLAERFGGRFLGESGMTGNVRITDITAGHPLTAGVTSVSWPGGSTLAVSDPNLRVLARFEGRPAIVAGQLAQGGKLVLVAENEAFARAGLEGLDDQTGPEPRSNERLLLNVVGWLTGCGGGP